MYAGLTLTTRWQKYCTMVKRRKAYSLTGNQSTSINLFHSLPSAIFKSLTFNNYSTTTNKVK